MSDEERRVGNGREIAVIGMAGRFPGARDLSEFWDNLRHGVESVELLSDEELAAAGVRPERLADPHYVKAASRLAGVEEFDPQFFGYSAREAELLDPQQRLFLEHAWEALEDAGYVPGRYPGLIGVYAGVAWNTYLLSNLTSHRELFEGDGAFQVFITNDKDFMPTRVSYKLDLKGPSVIVQTSCSTSLVAVHLACLSLLSYECDMALAGGVTIKVPQTEGYFHQEGGLASPDGHCRSFDARAAGTIFGSGVGLVVLKRLSDAIVDGDAIRAVVKGSAINNDGSLKVSFTAPSVEGQTEVIAAAQAIAEVKPETLDYVETHGTATALGDPIEVQALTKVFRESTDKKGFCALGSVKSNIGHLDAAAGVAGLIKAVLAIEHRELPPSLHFERPNPAIDFAASPFFVNAELRPWKRGDGLPLRAGVSSFGVGGTNAHVILEEAPLAAPTAPSRPWQLLVWSARSDAALEKATANLTSHFADHPEVEIADLAYTLKVGRAVFRHRRCLVCRSREEALAALMAGDSGTLLSAVDVEDPRRRPVVFLFPGQGAQHPDMTSELYEDEPLFRGEVDRCAELLRPSLGGDLRQLLYPDSAASEGAAERLAQTAVAQPALFVVEYALAKLWIAWGIRPQALAGHSLGEYVAACLAGVLPLADALELVAERGRLMQQLPPGTMASVPLAADELAALLPDGVEVAAVNEASRTVISGPPPAVAELELRLAARGVAVRYLATSHAFHSAAMEPIVKTFADIVRRRRLHPPEIPFVSNVTGTWITAEQAIDPDYWARQLRQPVRFADGMEELLRDPRAILLEVGPGRTLATLAARHPRRAGQPILASLPSARDGAPDGKLLLEALGRLWLAGLEIDWSEFYAGESRRRVSLPTYPFERQRYWIEPLAEAMEAREAVREQALGGFIKQPDVADWFYLPTWGPAAALSPLSILQRRILALIDPAGPSAALAALLAGDEREVITARPGAAFGRLGARSYSIRAAAAGDYDTLLADLAAAGLAPEVIVHAWTLGADADARDLRLPSVLALAASLARRSEAPLSVLLVSDGLHAVTGTEVMHPDKAAMLGVIRVLSQESSQVTCRAIDLPVSMLSGQQAGRMGDLLRAEMAVRGGEEWIAFRGAERWVPRLVPLRLTRPAADLALLRDRGSYLMLIDSLAGQGLALARMLAREAQARLTLLLPSEAIDPIQEESARESLQRLGAEVLVLPTDLGDAAAMRRSVAAAAARYGSLDGIVHALEPVRMPRLLAELSCEECERHVEIRLASLASLAESLAQREFDFCVVVSSLSAVLGGIAYAAETAASLAADAFVHAHNRLGAPPWRGLDLDLWQVEGESDPVLGMRKEVTAMAMAPREGEEAFLRSLDARGFGCLAVSTAELTARIEQRGERLTVFQGIAADGDSPRIALHPRPLATPYVAAAGELEERIAEVWQRSLGFERIGVHDNFFDLGGDSFVAIQVMSRLNEALGVKLSVAKLYQALTVRSLATLLERDESAAGDLRAAQFQERRESMVRRREFLDRRRAAESRD